MAFVIDASVALAWHFADEPWRGAMSLAERAVREDLVVPDYFAFEVSNGLLRGERAGRTRQRSVEAFVERLKLLAPHVITLTGAECYDRVLPLARACRLKLFDAGYLHVAMMHDLSLATFDAALRRAAEQVGTVVVETAA